MSKTSISSNDITEMVNGLHQLARNLWWTWNQEAQEIFQELSPRSWQNLYHNAVAVMHEVSDYELRMRLQDQESHCRNTFIENGGRNREPSIQFRDLRSDHKPSLGHMLEQHQPAYPSRSQLAAVPRFTSRETRLPIS